MTEEVKTQVDQPEQKVEQEAPKYTAVQTKAMEQGWRPKEEFEGEEDDFIDAAEFVRRGELFSKIEHQSRELKAVRQALDALKVHNTKIAANEYERAVKDLQKQQKTAIENGDTAEAFAITEQIDDAKRQRDRIVADAQRPAVQELNPEFVRWTEKNTWYNSDRAMRAVADTIGLQLHQEGHSPSEVLTLVEKEIRKEFSHKFSNPRAQRPTAVEGSTRGSSRAAPEPQLDEQEARIMRKIVATGVMTKDEYIAQLKRTKET